ncbi:UDP-N-acetyl-D-mannosamine dehydrogenase [Sanguibacter antarcticus]|uniref:UDP-N-acetyl-D-mannosaminuronic acid dehydrogenase n=1 Tax=Sanguibacter antarcticus TaxID=372484 RepID=A0A2A9DZZ6_9MICO|nr:UDP-N-acetyl-D-mannosamine dehydrogenase [Sanguibacter antarcticus]PFG32268.1 UDP-N-acetyl-D-mannosaminuronic acid dehydrogenase [Sanguibacter antarcticus]
MENIKTVAVIGLGYIGLPTAAILATQGLDVIGVDIKQSTVDAVNRGEVPFVEPDLGTYLAGAVKQGNLSASTKTPAADAYIVAVPTPFCEDHAPDLSYIEAAADALAEQLVGGELIILESTSPPGATAHMAQRILAARPDLDQADERTMLYFAHCPERVLPGRVMIELVTNDRIVGGLSDRAAERAKSLYETFCQGEILLTDAKTAEMAKLVENSFRDVNIAFANELSQISDRLDIDVWELIRLANRHPRVNILQPGPGVGGHCIAVDPWFIVEAAPDLAHLIRTARHVNDAKPQWVIDKVCAKADQVAQPVVAIFGLAFKANIDDLRESPALKIVDSLSRRRPSAQFLVVEPHVKQLPEELISRDNVRLVGLDEAVEKANVAVLLVDHADFASDSIDPISAAFEHVVDTRGMWQ